MDQLFSQVDLYSFLKKVILQLLRFFDAYAKQGVKFWAMSIQNEPSSGLDPFYGWQTMSMTSDMEGDFLAELLGPAIRGSDITKNLKIMIYSDQRVGIKEYVSKVCSLQNICILYN